MICIHDAVTVPCYECELVQTERRRKAEMFDELVSALDWALKRVNTLQCPPAALRKYFDSNDVLHRAKQLGSELQKPITLQPIPQDVLSDLDDAIATCDRIAAELR